MRVISNRLALLKRTILRSPVGFRLVVGIISKYTWLCGHLAFPMMEKCGVLPTDGAKNFDLQEPLVEQDALAIRHFNDALFIPEFGAVYEKNGKVIDVSLLVRGPGGFRKPFPAPITIERSTYKDCLELEFGLYGGTMYNAHYGHFLTESLARLWPLSDEVRISELRKSPLSDETYLPVLFSTGSKMSVWISQVQTMIKALENVFCCQIQVLKHPAIIHHLIIPDLSMIHNWKIHSAFPRFTRKLGRAVVKVRRGDDVNVYSPKKYIYLSRKRLGPMDRSIINEHELEKKLQEAGFEIVYPEMLPLADQICVLTEADVVAGPIGSAFHTMLLAEVCGKKFIYLVRPGQGNRNYPNIDAMSQVQAYYVPCLKHFPLSMKRSTKKDVFCDVPLVMQAIQNICE